MSSMSCRAVSKPSISIPPAATPRLDGRTLTLDEMLALAAQGGLALSPGKSVTVTALLLSPFSAPVIGPGIPPRPRRQLALEGLNLRSPFEVKEKSVRRGPTELLEFVITAKKNARAGATDRLSFTTYSLSAGRRTGAKQKIEAQPFTLVVSGPSR